MKIIVTYIVIIIAVLGLGFWLFQTSNKPVDPSSLPGTAYAILGQNHIPDGTHPTVAYNSNPPSSGDHYASPAPWGIYKTTLADETVVHNLEHGGIWISYKTGADADTIAKLEDFAHRYAKVIVEPRDSNDASISFASWGFVQNFEQFDESAMVNFIQAHYDQGPEKVM